MRDEHGQLRATAVAIESMMREKYGLPSYIAELDAPRNGLDRMEDQNREQDQTRDPDTMPAQGWLHVNARCSHIPITDVGWIPALRKESTMAGPTMASGTLTADVIADELRPFPESDDRFGYDQETVYEWATRRDTEDAEVSLSDLRLSQVARLVTLADEVAEEHRRRAAQAIALRDWLREVVAKSTGTDERLAEAKAVLR